MPNALRWLACLGLMLIMAGCATQTRNYTSKRQEQSELAARAAAVLRQQSQRPDDQKVPAELLKRTRCIAVFPKIAQAGVIVGGHGGAGLISCRDSKNGFKDAAPAIFNLSAGSIGLQLGARTQSTILLFTTPASVATLAHARFKLGSNIGATTGPIGYSRPIPSNPDKPVLIYNMGSRGLYAGLNLSGSRITFNQDANTAVYGPHVSARKILLERSTAPHVMRQFTQALARFMSTDSHDAD